MRAVNGPPGGNVAAACCAEGFGQRLENRLEIVAPQGGQFGVSVQRQVCLGKMALGPGFDGELQGLQHMGAIDGDLRARLCHARFDRIGPCRIDVPALEQRIALAHRLFVPAGSAAMAPHMRHDLAVKEAPAVRCPAAEHAVHGWRQPDDADQVCEV